jgi:hypothetical protein
LAFCRPLPGRLGRTFHYDGISPVIPHAIKVTGENNMKFPLVGRGDVNPLKKVRYATSHAAAAADTVSMVYPHPLLACLLTTNTPQDPFGAGMRISTHYAYLGGRLCATIAIPNPTSGTIFGMYLIDIHPKGELAPCLHSYSSNGFVFLSAAVAVVGQNSSRRRINAPAGPQASAAALSVPGE